MTTTAKRDAANVATIPHALLGLSEHIVGNTLPNPVSVDISDQATVWLLEADVPTWLDRAIELGEQTAAPGPTADWISHTAFGVLHASCIRIRLRWITQVDHVTCLAADCDRVLCYDPVDQPCPGTSRAGCPHLAEFFCDEHSSECHECRNDSAAERAKARWF